MICVVCFVCSLPMHVGSAVAMSTLPRDTLVDSSSRRHHVCTSCDYAGMRCWRTHSSRLETVEVFVFSVHTLTIGLLSWFRAQEAPASA